MGNDMNPIAAAGMGIGTGLASNVIQLGLQPYYNQQTEDMNKHMVDYQMQKQYEMWLKTGYVGQMQQMKKAGLNPALLYGMGGAAGGTTGNASASPTQGHASPMDIGQMMQLGIQKELAESQVRLNDAQAQKISGVDTGKTQTEIDLNQISKQFNQLQLDIANKTKEEAINAIINTTEKLAGEANKAIGEGVVALDDDVIRARKQEIIAQGAQAVIQKDLAEMMKTKTQAEINKINQDIKNSIQQLINQGKTVDNDTIRAKFETNLGNRLSLQAIQAIGGLVNMYISKKTIDVNK